MGLASVGISTYEVSTIIPIFFHKQSGNCHDSQKLFEINKQIAVLRVESGIRLENYRNPARRSFVTECKETHSVHKPSDAIANYWHTLFVVILIALNAVRSALQAANGTPNRPRMYLRIILFEWLILAVVVLGVRLTKAPLETILGKRWRTPLEFFRDIGIGVALWFVALVTVGIPGGPHSGAPTDRGIAFLIPQTSFEMLLWLIVAISAGFCEEAVYRGYLQRQFGALTRSAIAGVLVSSALFGAEHLYQGQRRAAVIAASAILYGAVAEWRGTVRPGMFAHALEDGIAPILIRLMRR